MDAFNAWEAVRERIKVVGRHGLLELMVNSILLQNSDQIKEYSSYMYIIIPGGQFARCAPDPLLQAPLTMAVGRLTEEHTAGEGGGCDCFGPLTTSARRRLR